MRFIFNPDHSTANKTRHGIDFVTAQALWLDPFFVEVPVKETDENRAVVIGRMGGDIWSASVIYQGKNVRPQAVRKSTAKEIEIYERNTI